MISLMISTMLLLILFGVGLRKRERRLTFHRFMLGREAVQRLTAGMKVLERLFPFAAARSTLLLGSLFFIPVLMGFIGLFNHLLWFSIGCFVVSLFAPWAGYTLRCMWWQRKCRLQMKEGLRLMSTAIRSGRTFVEALQRAALELSFPLRNLWLQAEREMRLGVTEGEAFHCMIGRTGVKDFSSMALQIELTIIKGGRLSHVLDDIASYQEDEEELVADLRSETSSYRLSAYALPLILVGLLLWFWPSILPLITQGWFLTCFIAALSSMALGILITFRLVQNLDV